MKTWEALTARTKALPPPAQDMALRGLQKVVAFQDVDYGREYLSRLENFARLDQGQEGFVLTIEAAKHIANAMAYDDIIRVAGLKTRAQRFARIETEMRAGGNPVELTEYFHPRAEEIASLLPARIGERFENSPSRMARLDRWFSKGRRLRTRRIGPFLVLYALGGLRGYRRRTRRHEVEQAHLDAWQARCLAAAEQNQAFAAELLRCRRLVKGYSDTHAHSLSKFARVMAAAELVQGRQDAAQWVARLREAALQDEKGDALDGAVRTIESFRPLQP
jgi:indolepyruvate ferredoxin oxidoreductase beta subunit